MTGILKVDTIQKNDGTTPTAKDLGLNTAGNILQVVNGYMNSQLEGAFSSSTDCFSVTITPTYVNSKILVMVNMVGCLSRSNGTYGKMWVAKGPSRTVLTHFADYLGGPTLSNTEVYPNTSFIDSPNTTSPITYYVMVRRNGGSGNLAINHYEGGGATDPTLYAHSRMTLMEIAG
jgi:hypothetical protein